MNTVICRNAYGAEFPTPKSELTQRMSAFGVIIQNETLLMTRQWDGYALPGGGA